MRALTIFSLLFFSTSTFAEISLVKAVKCKLDSGKSQTIKAGRSFDVFEIGETDYKLIYGGNICTVSSDTFFKSVDPEVAAAYNLLTDISDPPTLEDSDTVIKLGHQVVGAVQANGKEHLLHREELLDIVDNQGNTYIVQPVVEGPNGNIEEGESVVVKKIDFIQGLNQNARAKLAKVYPDDAQLIASTKQFLELEGSSFMSTREIPCSRGRSLAKKAPFIFQGKGTWGFLLKDPKTGRICQTASKNALRAVNGASAAAIRQYMGGSKVVELEVKKEVKDLIHLMASVSESTAMDAEQCAEKEPKPEEKFEYAKCKAGRNYLDKDVDIALSLTTKDENWDQDDLSHCILESLKRTVPANFAFCPSSAASPSQKSTKKRRPCVTDDYHKLVTTQFKQAMSCLGIKPLDYFRIINHESQFNTSIMSPSGVAGIAMMTSSTAQYINQHLTGSTKKRPIFEKLSETKRIGDYIKNPGSCKQLSQVMDSGPYSGRVSTCDRVRLPENPANAFIYGGINYLMSKKDLEKTLGHRLPNIVASKSDRQKRCGNAQDVKACEKSLNKEMKDKFMEDLVVWSYNAGIGGIRSFFKSYMRYKGFGTKTTVSYGGIVKGLERYIKASKKYTPKRCAEISGYRKKVVEEAKFVENKLNRDSSKEYIQCTN